MNDTLKAWLLWLTMVASVAAATLWHTKIIVEPYKSIYDPRIHAVGDFMRTKHFTAGKPKDFVGCADQFNLDYRLLPVIALKESSGGRNFTLGTQNIMGIVYRDGGKDKLVVFSSIKDSICKSAQLISHYKGATLEAKIKIYNSINPNYWPDTKRYMAEIK